MKTSEPSGEWLRAVFLREQEKPLGSAKVEDYKRRYVSGHWTTPEEPLLPWVVRVGFGLVFVGAGLLGVWKQDWLFLGFMAALLVISAFSFFVLDTRLPAADEEARERQVVLLDRLVDRWGSLKAAGVYCNFLLRDSGLDLYSVSEDEAFEQLLTYARKEYLVETSNCTQGHVVLCAHVLPLRS